MIITFMTHHGIIRHTIMALHGYMVAMDGMTHGMVRGTTGGMIHGCILIGILLIIILITVITIILIHLTAEDITDIMA